MERQRCRPTDPGPGDLLGLCSACEGERRQGSWRPLQGLHIWPFNTSAYFCFRDISGKAIESRPRPQSTYFLGQQFSKDKVRFHSSVRGAAEDGFQVHEHGRGRDHTHRMFIFDVQWDPERDLRLLVGWGRPLTRGPGVKVTLLMQWICLGGQGESICPQTSPTALRVSCFSTCIGKRERFVLRHLSGYGRLLMCANDLINSAVVPKTSLFKKKKCFSMTVDSIALYWFLGYSIVRQS